MPITKTEKYFFKFQRFIKSFQKYRLVTGMPKIFISNESENYGATWLKNEIWDQKTIEKFYNLIKKKDSNSVIFDIGSQTGCFTLLSKFLPHTTWYAFEPIEEAANELKRNIKKNRIKQVTVSQCAVSNQKGIVNLKLPLDTHWGLATLGDKLHRFKEYQSRQVLSITLDEFVLENNIQRLDFMKIDTEGWEFFVLQGAKNLIQKYSPVILMELNEDNLIQTGISKENLYQFLEEINYRYEFFSEDDILCFPKDKNLNSRHQNHTSSGMDKTNL